MISTAETGRRSPFWLFGNLALWLVIVVFYAQSFALWQFLSTAVGQSVAELVPLIAAAVLAAVMAFGCFRNRSEIEWRWVVAGGVVFLAGLLSSDPAFPAKRIHVPEYFLLTVMVFLGLRRRSADGTAIVGAVMLSTMLGGIDELIQGAMPTRTFGLCDMFTNLIGAVSAGFLIRARYGEANVLQDARAMMIPVLSVGLGFLLLMLAVSAHKGFGFPIWGYLPAIASLSLLITGEQVPFGEPASRHACQAIGAICFIAVLLVYGIDALDLDFH